MSTLKNSAIFVVVLCFCWQIGFSVEEDYDCEKNFDKAEACFHELFLIGKQVKWDKESFSGLCHTEFDAVGCIQEYKTKCIKGMASMVFNLLSKKFNATFNRLCSDTGAMEEFLEHFNCVKDSLMSDRARLCAEQYHLRLEMIDQVKKEERFPIICCSFYEIRQCITNELQNSAGCKDKSKSVEYFENLTTNFVGDLNKMFCSDWKSLEVCRANMAPNLADSFAKISAMNLETAEKSKKIKSFLRLLKHLIEAAGQ